MAAMNIYIEEILDDDEGPSPPPSDGESDDDNDDDGLTAVYGGSVDSEVAGGGSGAVNGSSKNFVDLGDLTAQLQHINETKVDANTGCPSIDIDSGSSGSQDGQERGQQAQASSGEGEKLSSKQAKKKTKKKMQKKRRQQAAAVKNDNRNVVTTAHEGVDAPKERVWDGVVYHCRTRQGTAKPPARGGAAVTLLGESLLFVMGGADRIGNHFNDVHLLDTSKWEWVSTGLENRAGQSAPRARSGHSAIDMDNSGSGALIFGGADLQRQQMFSDIFLFKMDATGGGFWTEVMPSSSGITAQARNAHTATWIPSSLGERMIVFGGTTEDGPTNEVLVLHYTMATDSTEVIRNVYWTAASCSGTPPRAREMHSATYCPHADGASVVIVGGRFETEEVANDVWILQIQSLESASDKMLWSRLEDLPGPRCGHSAVILPFAAGFTLVCSNSNSGDASARLDAAGYLVVFGGIDGAAFPTGVTVRDPNSKSLLTRTTSSLWSYEEVEPAIPERFSHAAVQVAIKNTKNTADAAPEAAVVSKVTPAMLVYGGLNVQEDITDVAAISLRCI